MRRRSAACRSSGKQARQETTAAGTRHLVGRDEAPRHRRRRAAEVLGIAEADQSRIGRLGVELAREGAGFVPGVDVRRDLALDEAAHAGAKGSARGELVGVDGDAAIHART